MRKIASTCGYCALYIIVKTLPTRQAEQARRQKKMPLCRVMVVYKYLYIARKSGHGEKRVAHRPNHTIFTADPRKNIRRERAPEPRSGPADEWKFSSPPLSRPLVWSLAWR